MSKDYDSYREWENHDGKRVKIDGKSHILKVSVYNARYPYERKVISVYAEPCNRKSKDYLEHKAYLGDDWSIDVLDSDVTVQTEVMSN